MLLSYTILRFAEKIKLRKKCSPGPLTFFGSMSSVRRQRTVTPPCTVTPRSAEHWTDCLCWSSNRRDKFIWLTLYSWLYIEYSNFCGRHYKDFRSKKGFFGWNMYLYFWGTNEEVFFNLDLGNIRISCQIIQFTPMIVLCVSPLA